MAMTNNGRNRPPIVVTQKMSTVTGHPVEVFRVDDTYIYGIVDFVDDVSEAHRWWRSGCSPEKADWSLRSPEKEKAIYTLSSECTTASGLPVKLFTELDGALHGAYLCRGEWLPCRWSLYGEAIYTDQSEGVDLVGSQYVYCHDWRDAPANT
jgi:hypothetical protein